VLSLGEVDKTNRPGLFNMTQATWGASPIQDDNGTWHIFHAQMSHNCGVFQSWMTNSFVGRSVSTTGDVGGPYQFEQTVIPEFAHNPQTRKLLDGSYAIFMIGGWHENPCHCGFPEDGTSCPKQNTTSIEASAFPSMDGSSATCSFRNWTKNACPSTMPGPNGDCCGPNLNSGCGISIAHSETFEGPWTVTPLKITDQWDSDQVFCAHTNPSPVVLPNGTIVMAFNAGCCDPECAEMIGTAISDNGWEGPWRLLSKNSIFPGSTSARGHGAEDPFLWHTKRGFHLLAHNFEGPQGASAYGHSVDGHTWTLSPETPYNCTISFTDGTSEEIAICGNRPQLAFNSDGTPIGLFTGAGKLPATEPEHGLGEYSSFRPVLH